MAFRAVIFDLDGTLVRTEKEYRIRTVRAALKELGITDFSPKAVDRFWFGLDREKTIKKEFCIEPERFWGVFRKYDKIDMRKKFTKPYGDAGFIPKIREAGLRTGIVTGAPLKIAEMETEMLGKQNFDVIVIAQRSNGITPKPHPHGLEECLNLLGIENRQAMHVGNAEEDVITAQKAGVLDVLIDRGDHKIEIRTRPSVTINSLYELEKIISKR
jgi:phosphoglycolate phosphatase-like HAD superfamily hydrolase